MAEAGPADGERAKRFARESEPSVEPPQEDELRRRETACRVAQLWAEDGRQAVALLAIAAARGDREDAARRLYASAEARATCRLGSERDAQKAISRAWHALAAPRPLGGGRRSGGPLALVRGPSGG
jgi:hypothetical protein